MSLHLTIEDERVLMKKNNIFKTKYYDIKIFSYSMYVFILALIHDTQHYVHPLIQIVYTDWHELIIL